MTRTSIEALLGLAGANARTIAACHALARFCHGHPAELMQEIGSHRRELAIDIVRALLARGASIDQAHRALGIRVRVRPADGASAWSELALAERELHREFRRVLAQPYEGDDISELLGLHYLRVELHHRELAGLRLDHRPPVGVSAFRQGCDA